MKKLSKEVFLGVRFLISLFFLLISFSAPESVRGTLVVLTAVYFSLGLISYLKPEKTRLINRFVDLLLLPPLVFLSNDPKTIFSLIPPLVLHTNRNPLIAGLLLTAGAVLSTYQLSEEPLELFATLILLVATSGLLPLGEGEAGAGEPAVSTGRLNRKSGCRELPPQGKGAV